MMMLMLIMAGAAAAATSPTPPPLPDGIGEARTVMERQLASPPRSGTTGGVGAEEAEAIMKAYIASIGRPVEAEERNQSR